MLRAGAPRQLLAARSNCAQKRDGSQTKTNCARQPAKRWTKRNDAPKMQAKLFVTPPDPQGRRRKKFLMKRSTMPPLRRRLQARECGRLALPPPRPPD